MARSKNNIATQGLSGRVDQFVFRQRFGQTIVSKQPRTSGAASDAQLAIQSRFKQAATYAKAVLTDPSLQALYSARAKEGQSAYNVAFRDFFKAPEIGDIDAAAYNGAAGSLIAATVTDDVKVTAVQVKIEKDDGSVVEEGAAQLQADGLHWVYTATAQNDALAGSVITIVASDLPNHFSSKQVKL